MLNKLIIKLTLPINCLMKSFSENQYEIFDTILRAVFIIQNDLKNNGYTPII